MDHSMKHENLLSQMLCRICGTEQTSDTMNNLFTSVHNGLYFVDILEECLQKSVTRDNGFPLNICLDCTSNLIVVYNFRLIAFDSEKKFKQMLDSDGFYKNVELFVEETETDVKPSYFIDCAAIEELNTNCDERQDTKTEMVVNESGKLKVESYECYLCKETYRRIDNLRRHFRTCHRITENLWSCSDCQKRLSSRKHLVKHLYKHRTPACDYCPETFTTFRLLQQHCQQTHSNELVLHQCVQCPKKFALRAQFDMHKHLHNQRNNQDNHNAPFNCTSCSETFTTATQLKAHTRALHTTHLCSECGKTFKNNSLLVSHQKVHKSEKPFVCSRCPSRFKWKVALTYHMTIHDQERKHVCETCGKSFSTRSAMKGHMKIHTGIRPFECDKCSKRFYRRTHLRRHHLSHTGEKPYICQYCEKGFRQTAQLNKHLRYHVGEKTYACHLCPEKFKLKADMKRHEYEHYESRDFGVETTTSES